METKYIYIEWSGPYTLKDIGYKGKRETYSIQKTTKLNDQKKDYGIYQIYGFHPLYGNSVLLYIGKAEKQTFAKRISQEGWEYNADYKNIEIYAGYICDKDSIFDKIEWSESISMAEKMLIYAHEPSKNSSNIQSISKDKNKLNQFKNIKVFNYDSCRSLMPEISGEMWIKEIEIGDRYTKK